VLGVADGNGVLGGVDGGRKCGSVADGSSERDDGGGRLGFDSGGDGGLGLGGGGLGLGGGGLGLGVGGGGTPAPQPPPRYHSQSCSPLAPAVPNPSSSTFPARMHVLRPVCSALALYAAGLVT
jgi:hypothetical protein